jgi:hypothetical protein
MRPWNRSDPGSPSMVEVAGEVWGSSPIHGRETLEHDFM